MVAYPVVCAPEVRVTQLELEPGPLDLKDTIVIVGVDFSSHSYRNLNRTRLINHIMPTNSIP
jgi:hypothetical protein